MNTETAATDPAAPFVVCPDCQGHGGHAPGIVRTNADTDPHDDYTAVDAALRDGWGRTTCVTCEGRRVVTPTVAADWHDGADYRAEVAAERRHFGL